MPFPSCGYEVAENAAFCSHCGAPQGLVRAVPAAAAAFGESAGFWTRVVGRLVDTVIVIVGSVVGAAIEFAIYGRPFIVNFVGIAYSWYFTARGQTLGQAALGIRIIDAAGNPPGAARALGRILASILTSTPSPIGLMRRIGWFDGTSWSGVKGEQHLGLLGTVASHRVPPPVPPPEAMRSQVQQPSGGHPACRGLATRVRRRPSDRRPRLDGAEGPFGKRRSRRGNGRVTDRPEQFRGGEAPFAASRLIHYRSSNEGLHLAVLPAPTVPAHSGERARGDPEEGRLMLLSAGTMTGNEVVNAAGESLGSVEEIMIDTTTGPGQDRGREGRPQERRLIPLVS